MKSSFEQINNDVYRSPEGKMRLFNDASTIARTAIKRMEGSDKRLEILDIEVNEKIMSAGVSSNGVIFVNIKVEVQPTLTAVSGTLNRKAFLMTGDQSFADYIDGFDIGSEVIIPMVFKYAPLGDHLNERDGYSEFTALGMNVPVMFYPSEGIDEVQTNVNKIKYNSVLTMYVNSKPLGLEPKLFKKKYRLFRDFIYQLAHLHSHAVFHGDLHSHNVSYLYYEGQYTILFMDLARYIKFDLSNPSQIDLKKFRDIILLEFGKFFNNTLNNSLFDMIRNTGEFSSEDEQDAREAIDYYIDYIKNTCVINGESIIDEDTENKIRSITENAWDKLR